MIYFLIFDESVTVSHSIFQCLIQYLIIHISMSNLNRGRRYEAMNTSRDTKNMCEKFGANKLSSFQEYKPRTNVRSFLYITYTYMD